MPNANVRANARTLPEEIERPHLPDQTAQELYALAADFEAAWAEEGVISESSCSDAEASAAVDRVSEIARKIVALPATGAAMLRMKARVYLWSEGTDFETFAAENEGKAWSQSVLVSLFRDLGVDRPVEASPDEEPTTIASGCSDELLSDREMADLAAMSFEPVPVETLAKLQAISDQEWLDQMVIIRIAFVVLSKSKEEIKELVKKRVADDYIEGLQASIAFLRSGVEFLTVAETRLLVASDALVAEARA